MWLLNVTNYKLEAFEGRRIPQYAILSHRWATEEVSFKDMQGQQYRDKQGFTKISSCCKQAITDGLFYIWVDTCCIDKSSSAELSEAINSMYRWYKDAKVCYAYLSDVVITDEVMTDPILLDMLKSDFTESIWFTRSWTLQELLAPRELIFYDRGWHCIGSKLNLAERISESRGIPTKALYHFIHDEWSVAERMSWASNRRTTRVEDRTYSLLGLFDINMPLLYGEGNKAFQRLQEHIMAVSDDLSIFAWSKDPNPQFPMLANGPQSFSGSYDLMDDKPPGLETCRSISLRTPKIRFFKEVVPYALSKNSIEGIFTLHHFAFNIDCLCVGQIFLDYEPENPGPMEDWERSLWLLFIFIEYDARTDIHRRVTFDGANNVAFPKTQVHTRSIERNCKFVKNAMHDVSSDEISEAQIRRCIPLSFGEHLTPHFTAIGTFAHDFYPEAEMRQQQQNHCKFSPLQSRPLSPCFGAWYSFESLSSDVPFLIIHFAFTLGSQPRVLFSFRIHPKDELQTLRTRHSGLTTIKHHACYTSGCAVVDPRTLRPGKLKNMYLAAANRRKYQSRVIEGWPMISIPGKVFTSINIDGLGTICLSGEQHKTAANAAADTTTMVSAAGSVDASDGQRSNAPFDTVYAHFQFRAYIPGLETFPDAWASFPKIREGKFYAVSSTFKWPGRRFNSSGSETDHFRI